MKETKNGGMKLNKREWGYVFEKEKLLCEFIQAWVSYDENDHKRVNLVDHYLKRLLKVMDEYRDAMEN